MSITEESTYQYLGEFSKIIDRLEAKNQIIADLTAQVMKLKQKLKDIEEESSKTNPGPFKPLPAHAPGAHPFK